MSRELRIWHERHSLHPEPAEWLWCFRLYTQQGWQIEATASTRTHLARLVLAKAWQYRRPILRSWRRALTARIVRNDA